MSGLRNRILYFLGLITFAIINILAINNYAYDKNGNIQCDNYVLNTYLYVMLSFIIMTAVMLVDEKFRAFEEIVYNYGLISIFVILILLFGLIILLNSTTNQILSHLYWTILLVILGILLSTTVRAYGDITTIYMAFIITIIITAVMGVIGFKYGNLFITYDFDKYLTWALIALIIAIFMNTFIDNPDIMFYLSIAGAVIFSLLLMSYNNKLRKNAKSCVTPLYPKESFGLIIKIANLFQDVLSLVAKARRQ